MLQVSSFTHLETKSRKANQKKKKKPNMLFIIEGVLFGNLIDCYFWFYHEKDFSAYSDLEYRPSLED